MSGLNRSDRPNKKLDIKLSTDDLGYINKLSKAKYNIGK